MAEKDIHEKRLEDYNDVFADIYNTLLFGEKYLEDEKLSPGPTTSVYKAEMGEIAEQFRDVLKMYESGSLGLVSLGIENQTGEDKIMPVRVMGYDYGNYRGMINNGEEITPVTTIVLNFGEKRWSKAKSLHEMMRIPEKMKNYVQDYKIRVYDIAFLSDNIIEEFKSDFKIVARFFKDRRLGKNEVMKDANAKIRHVEAVLDLFSVFTKDESYRRAYSDAIKQMEENGEEVDMCYIAQGLINEGMEKGIEKGIEKGLEALVKTLKTYVSDFKELYKTVTANETYAHVTEEQVRIYFEGEK